MIKKICLNCSGSKFFDFDKYGNNRALKCFPGKMRVSSQTENLECFKQDTPENIKIKEGEYERLFKNKG